MKPAITITEQSIRVSTDAFEMTIEFSVKGVTIDDLKYDLKSLEQEIERENEDHYVSTPVAESTGKPSRAHTGGMKVCATCGKTFKANSNRQRYCSRKCGMRPTRAKNKKLLEDMTEDDLEKTLNDIEKRRKQPYEISK